MAHHDAFGVSGRTGRVLQQREIRRIGRSTVHRDLGGPGIGADDEPRHLRERGVGRKLGGDAGVRACVGEHHRRMAIAAYGRQGSGQAPGTRREARHGDQARVEAGKQRSDVAEAGLEHDQRALARSRPFQQQRRQGARAAVE